MTLTIAEESRRAKVAAQRAMLFFVCLFLLFVLIGVLKHVNGSPFSDWSVSLRWLVVFGSFAAFFCSCGFSVAAENVEEVRRPGYQRPYRPPGSRGHDPASDCCLVFGRVTFDGFIALSENLATCIPEEQPPEVAQRESTPRQAAQAPSMTVV